MFHAIGWIVILSLLALWSFGAWAFHSLAAWTLARAGVLTGGTIPDEVLRLPDWLAPWVPPEWGAAAASALSALQPAIDALVAWAPSLAGGLSMAVWVVWAVGAALLVVLGFVLSGVIAVLRRKPSPPSTPLVTAESARR